MSNEADLVFYEDLGLPRWFQEMCEPGVSEIVIRYGDGTKAEGALLSEGNGKFYWQPNDNTGD